MRALGVRAITLGIGQVVSGACHLAQKGTEIERHIIGDWPSGKAAGSGPAIGGSNPSSPANKIN